MRIKTLLAASAAVSAFAMIGTAAAQDLTQTIQERDELNCGVSTGLAGFSNPDSEGNWTGLDVDVCKAVAAAVLGDDDAVSYTPLTAQQRFTALQAGEVDILSRNTTWTLTRDTSLGLHFAGVTFYDGQGFMVPADIEVDSALDLDGASVCVQPGTTTELNLADYFRANDMEFEPVVIEQLEEVNAAYFSGRCDVYTTDRSGLASIRATVADNPSDHVILPETISKEPLGPAVRQGNDQFLNIVKWVVFALVEAEELGVNSENLDEMMDSENPGIQRLLGVSPGMGEHLGLDESWAYDVIAAVGNYGEIFDRNVGPDTAVGLDRGVNDLWTNGGIMYAMPVR
ncbi:amino acid ABC transporter substrate-binding protein [Fodinicurvata sp. EGI_FJ10296]|uniref:amino acid ABC transporter substrate-binding protein n=1 Tax=Fodinicurvata sp. EGI_FJ10296 TaxID=3231908 RepID=UPI003452BCD3